MRHYLVIAATVIIGLSLGSDALARGSRRRRRSKSGICTQERSRSAKRASAAETQSRRQGRSGTRERLRDGSCGK